MPYMYFAPILLVYICTIDFKSQRTKYVKIQGDFHLLKIMEVPPAGYLNDTIIPPSPAYVPMVAPI